MNIGIFIGGLTNGGAERVVCNLSNYLCKKHNVTIITMSSIESRYILDKKVNHKPLESRSESGNFIIKNIKRLVELNRIIKRKENDIYITFLPITSFIMLFFRKKIKVPIIVSVRNDPKVEYGKRIYNFLMRVLYPLADGYIFQTNEAKEYFNGIIKNSCEVIPNPINEQFITKPYLGERKKSIVSVGRLSEQKNHLLLIEAFSRISDKYSEYKLIIYGEGILRKILEDKIKELKLENRIHLPGNVKNIKEKIYDSSLFVLSSDYEGMPNALMEAMALGIPVISTDCQGGGARFLIDNQKNGILTPIKDVQAMSDAIDKVLSNKELSQKIGIEGRNIVNILNPNDIYKRWEEYIDKIYRNKGMK